jgi:hypothetical protein
MFMQLQQSYNVICNLINYICKVIVIQLITFQNPCNGNGNLIEGFGQVIVI